MPTGALTQRSQELGSIPRRKRSALQAGSPAPAPGSAACGLPRARVRDVPCRRADAAGPERQGQGTSKAGGRGGGFARARRQRRSCSPRYPRRGGGLVEPLPAPRGDRGEERGESPRPGGGGCPGMAAVAGEDGSRKAGRNTRGGNRGVEAPRRRLQPQTAPRCPALGELRSSDPALRPA